MGSKRVFISFAAEDSFYRDALVEQSKNERSPFEFTDMSVKEPWDDSWKTRCRVKIRGCDGLIALLSHKTRTADGARWEMKCASEEMVRMMGIYIQKDDKPAIPAELSGYSVVEWNWQSIKSFIDSL